MRARRHRKASVFGPISATDPKLSPIPQITFKFKWIDDFLQVFLRRTSSYRTCKKINIFQVIRADFERCESLGIPKRLKI